MKIKWKIINVGWVPDFDDEGNELETGSYIDTGYAICDNCNVKTLSGGKSWCLVIKSDIIPLGTFGEPFQNLISCDNEECKDAVRILAIKEFQKMHKKHKTRAEEAAKISSALCVPNEELK